MTTTGHQSQKTTIVHSGGGSLRDENSYTLLEGSTSTTGMAEYSCSHYTKVGVVGYTEGVLVITPLTGPLVLTLVVGTGVVLVPDVEIPV